MNFTPRQFLSAMLLGLLVSHAQAQTSEGTAEVLGVQVSRLETSPMGSFKGTLPGNLFASNLAVENWNTGTAVLLRIPAPRGAWLLPQAPKLISFQDDTRKDLSRTPEGVAADPFNRRTPVTFVFHGDTGDMYVCVASLRAPSVSATKVGGEIEVAYSGEPVATVTEPIAPEVGTVVAVGPFTVKVLEVRERTASEGPPPMQQPSQLPPTMRGLPPEGTPMPTLPPGQTLPPGAMTPQQLSERVQSRPPAQMQPSKRMAVKCELIAPAGGWIPVKLSVSDSKGNVSKFSPELLGNSSFTFTFSVKELAPFRVKLEAVNTDKAPVARIKFSSSIGVSKE
jgi:hypothetical protein